MFCILLIKVEFKLAYEKLKVRFDDIARRRTRQAVQSLVTVTNMCIDPFIDDLDGRESIDGKNFHYLIVPGKYFLLVKMGVTSSSSEDLAKRYKYSLGRGINIYAYEIKNGENIMITMVMMTMSTMLYFMRIIIHDDDDDDNKFKDNVFDDDNIQHGDNAIAHYDNDGDDDNYKDNATASYDDDNDDSYNVDDYDDYFIHISTTNRVEEDYSGVINIQSISRLSLLADCRIFPEDC